jgi:hypothetical protein
MTASLAVVMFVCYGLFSGWELSLKTTFAFLLGSRMLGLLRLYRHVHLHSGQRSPGERGAHKPSTSPRHRISWGPSRG